MKYEIDYDIGRPDRVVILPAQNKIRVFYNTGCGFNRYYDSIIVNGSDLYRWTTMRSPNTTVHYTYDNYVHTYPTAITDTFGVTSQMQDYDFRFGLPRTVIDQADNCMEYTYDSWGRTETVRGPKEIAAQVPYTIKHTYSGREAATGSTRPRAVSMAVTEHYDPQHPQNPIKTYTYCDGLGRIVQTRKEAAVNGVEKLVISGHTVVDALGRTVANYYPTEIHKDSTRFRFITDQSAPASTVTYDVLDRPKTQTAPDGATTRFAYGFDGTHLNRMLFSTITTDANGHSSTELKDVDGKPWAVQAAGQPFVYFDYNAAGDNTRTYAETGEWERSYTCDLLGRKTAYAEGQLFESFTYDGGNLSTQTQNWMENGITQSKTTHYHYNAHRLDSVRYDDALTVIYHYNNYGQIDSLYDESGVMCYQYGRMGEVTKETRIYALPFLSQPIALSTQYNYDSWGRIQNITYPDNEVVHYAYDLGGQLQSITNNSSYTYLDNVTYDRFGAKVSQTYGNGLVTNYSYNNLTRRLSNIATLNGNSQISSFAYTYDNVGNVTQVTSSCPWRNNQTFTESFTYDAADQLTAAQSVVSGQPSVSNYQLSVTYGNWGKISSYGLTQRDMQHNSTQSETQAYTYPSYNSIGSSQTLFAPEQRTITDANNNVATETLAFGINGSLRKREVQAQASYTEYYLFNSAANLKAYSNSGLYFAYYGYDASNTRTYKLSMLNQNQWVNGQPEPIHLQLQSAMFYPNAYLTFNQNGNYTKHYYNGSERIASRLGSNTHPTDATSNDRLEYRMMRSEEKFRENIQELVSDGQPVDFQGTVNLNSLQPVNATSDIFYYHTNHLGSTAFVTDNNATVTQGFLYAPFGEIISEYQGIAPTSALPKYAFNAKELDEETGMYYYEARYYNPPVFTSRDPMFEQYFWMSPYAYCANNPVKYVDPSGKACKDLPWNTIMAVIPKEKFVGYQRGQQCFALAKKQLNVVGYTCGSYYESTTHQAYTEQKGVNEKETHNVIKYIHDALNQGIPVLAGVDDSPGDPGNHDKTTDHFIVIVGQGNDENGNYFSFYDNATSSYEDGTNENNKLYYDSQNGKITGKSQNGYARNCPRDYTLTQIRETKALKPKEDE